MNKRMPVSIFISVLLILILTACAGAGEVKLAASDGAAGDWFGYAVSRSGDYAIVGAHCDDDRGDYSGSAYIYKRDGTTWSKQAKITASDGAAGDLFGQSVSISGNYVIVGAHCDDDGSGASSGSTYIYKRDGTTWRQQAKITASDGAAGNRFGYSVSISGDYVIVGALGADGSGASSGSAYIFKHDGTTWSQQAKIAASDGAAGNRFGYSVSISGDYVIVGALGADGSGASSGSAYIFKHDGTTWSQQAKIAASDGAAGDLFGQSVSISGDYAIVGAYCDDDSGDYSGSAYIYKRDGTIWSKQAKITASDGAAGDLFGQSVSISGDYVIVGAYFDDDNGKNSGSAYIYKRDGTTWSQQAKITASDSATGDRFGCSTSVSGNYVIVGAYCDDDHGASSGSAYIFKQAGTTWCQQAKITASGGAAGDLFGQSVSISGDYAIVGAYCDDDYGENSGSAYIYDIPTPGPSITGDLNGDFRITPADALIALKMAAGSSPPTTAADVNNDGVVSSLDALMILRAAAGLIAL